MEKSPEQFDPHNSRKEMEEKLSEMSPLFEDKTLLFDWNTKTYKEFDKEGLLKNYYEKEIKPYIQNNELKESEFLKNLRKNIYNSTFTTPGGGWKNTPCNKMEMKIADDISNYFEKIAVSTIYFDNNRQIAKQAIEKAFQTINNSNVEKTSKDGRCACTFVSHLGWIANRLGFPDLADKFGENTLCPYDPNYPNLSTTMSRPGFGLNSIGEDYSTDKIKDNIRYHVEEQIRKLKKKKLEKIPKNNL